VFITFVLLLLRTSLVVAVGRLKDDNVSRGSLNRFFLSPSHALPAGKEVDDYHDSRNDQQDVYKSSHGVTSHHAKQP
jgi:hypothetical protein